MERTRPVRLLSARDARGARTDRSGVPGSVAAGRARSSSPCSSAAPARRSRTASSDAVCSIMQRTTATAPATPGDPGVGDSDLDGPSLTDHPLIVLPFPGSVTVSCTYDERDPEKCVPHGGPGVSVQASGELKVERTPTSLDANGCPWQNLSAADQAPAERQRRGQGRQGRRLAERLPRPVDELSASPSRPTRPTTSPTATARAPNPVDPTTITGGRERPAHRGLLRRHQRQGLLPRAPARDGLRRGPPRVQRRQAHQPDDRAGDGRRLATSSARRSSSASATRTSRVSLGNTKDLADGKLHAVDIDISNQAGWDAYQAFLSSGKLPKEGTPGTTEPDQGRDASSTPTSRRSRPSSAASSSAGASTTPRAASPRPPTPTAPSTRPAFARYGDVGIAVTTKKDADGNVVGTPTRSLLLEGVDDSLVEGHLPADRQDAAVGPRRQPAAATSPRPSSSSCARPRSSRLADQIEHEPRRAPDQRARSPQSLRENHGVVEYKGVPYAFTGHRHLCSARRARPRRR